MVLTQSYEEYRRNSTINLFLTIIKMTVISEIYSKYIECNYQISTDTRDISTGSMFICLKGEKYDANLFADKAVKAGAKYVVTDNESWKGEEYIYVNDSNSVLSKLAKYHSHQVDTQFIAVGGSNGKTTTKEILFLILSTKFNTIHTYGNFNNHIGVPLTLLRVRPETEVAIIELGTNHPGEMDVICQLFPYKYGLLTNIGKEHLEGFGDIENVAREESVLYQYLIENNGKAVINTDDVWLNSMSKRISNKITYSINKDADINAILLQEMPNIEFKINNNSYTAKDLSGDYNVYNLLAATSLATYFGFSLDEALHIGCTYKSTNNRSQWIEANGIKILLDAYNANPSSVSVGLKSFSKLSGTKAVLLGDMLELGEFENQEHLDIFNFASSLNFEELHLVGPRFKAAALNYPYKYDDIDSLLAWLDTHPLTADYIYIKGSRGLKMEKAVDHYGLNPNDLIKIS